MDKTDQHDPPFILVLKRKTIRVFPDGTKVAMYWNDKLGTSFAIPFAPTPNIYPQVHQPAPQAEEVYYPEENEPVQMPLSEGVVDTLKQIAKNGHKMPVEFVDGSNTIVDPFSAKALVGVLDGLSGPNRNKFSDLLNKDRQSFMKALTFSMKHSNS